MSTKLARVTGPIECATWCESQDGHDNELYAVDQVCFSEERLVYLSESGVDINTEGVTRDAIGLHLSTNDAKTPVLVIDPDRVSDGMRLTVDELDDFIANITELRDILRAAKG